MSRLLQVEFVDGALNLSDAPLNLSMHGDLILSDGAAI